MEIRWRVRGLQLETLGFQLVVPPLSVTKARERRNLVLEFLDPHWVFRIRAL